MYRKNNLLKQYLILFLFAINATLCIAQKLETFVEFGMSIHTGERTPLWQVSNQRMLMYVINGLVCGGGVVN